ncbi:MAG: hypothetical protein DME97_06165 [Verrucomicrobia bacterium]|nr:MAG: hypothetical protein DME97_06165 [Verrucomicrobiota bacterium]
MNYILALAFGVGLVAGLRALTAPAAVAWAAQWGWLHLHGSPLSFMASTWAAILFLVLAIFELIGDLLPGTPKRTAPGPLAARMLSGGLCGACVCASANQSLFIGAALGGLGALLGAFAGYELRRRLVAGLNVKDIFIAIPEDLIAIGLAWFFVTR